MCSPLAFYAWVAFCFLSAVTELRTAVSLCLLRLLRAISKGSRQSGARIPLPGGRRRAVAAWCLPRGKTAADCSMCCLSAPGHSPPTLANHHPARSFRLHTLTPPHDPCLPARTQRLYLLACLCDAARAHAGAAICKGLLGPHLQAPGLFIPASPVRAIRPARPLHTCNTGRFASLPGDNRFTCTDLEQSYVRR